ncbi:MAG TPA: YhjD/YihY/BrkB family envelope integrity protein [Vicinamibacterales bacterium]
MLRTFDIPISWLELFKRTARETIADDCLSLAAQLAYYFFLSLFPALLFLLALASFMPIENVADRMIASLQSVAPPDMLGIVRDEIMRIARSDSGGLLTFGFIAALWSSSAAMLAIVNTLNKVYDIEESRPWWKVRLIAIALTIALAIFLLLSFLLVVLGPTVAEYLARSVGLGPVFEWTWKIAQWPVALFLISTALGLVYYFAPDAEQDWVWITPGAVLGTVLWFLASLGFKYYVSNFGDYTATYGAIGGVMVLLLWFYLSGLAILVGAEMNAEIEHASPYGKAPGEKVPGGQRKKIGVAAARAHEEAHRPQPVVPSPAMPRPSSNPGTAPSAGGYVVGTALLATRIWARLRGKRRLSA